MKAGAPQGRKNLATPHDAVFRKFLTHTATARDFIRLHLPATLLAACDLSTLKLASGSFISEELRPSFCDVLYSLQTRTGRGAVYVLIEHQSTPDSHMAFRLLRYAVATMQRHLESGYKKLPLVIPILFYTGRKPWPFSTRWLDNFDDPALAAQLYGKAFPLIDITLIPDDEIMRHRRMAPLTLLQKHIRSCDLASLPKKLASLLKTTRITGQQFSTLINYLVRAGETPDMDAFLRELAQRVPQHKDELMTIAEQLEQRGMKKGLEKGIEKGRAKGKLEVARSLLKMGIPFDVVLKATRLPKKELVRLRHRTTRRAPETAGNA